MEKLTDSQLTLRRTVSKTKVNLVLHTILFDNIYFDPILKLVYLQNFAFANFQLLYVGALNFQKFQAKIKKRPIGSTGNQFDCFAVFFATLP